MRHGEADSSDAATPGCLWNRIARHDVIRVDPFEHALMSERTRDGLDAARARGRSGGQKPKLTPRQAKIAQDMYDELGPDGRPAHTVQQIADEFGVTRPTIYRVLERRTTSTAPDGPAA